MSLKRSLRHWVRVSCSNCAGTESYLLLICTLVLCSDHKRPTLNLSNRPRPGTQDTADGPRKYSRSDALPRGNRVLTALAASKTNTSRPFRAANSSKRLWHLDGETRRLQNSGQGKSSGQMSSKGRGDYVSDGKEAADKLRDSLLCSDDGGWNITTAPPLPCDIDEVKAGAAFCCKCPHPAPPTPPLDLFSGLFGAMQCNAFSYSRLQFVVNAMACTDILPRRWMRGTFHLKNGTETITLLADQ